ncbi:MAG: membrane protein insertase YidC [Candidatus Chisholmbacteria bacterium]|nr:membrane protein insertase YidC [Candidatus Chisholmbacteria bacterium]
MFNTFLYQPLFQALLFLTKIFSNSFALGIIALTVIIRILLIPLTLPSLKSAQKLASLKPELDKLKAKHGSDKKKLQLAQLELYRQHGINPAAGCLPNIIQLVILIALYRVFIDFINQNTNDVNLHFLWLNLSQPDPYFIFPIIAGLSQLVLSLMLSPAIEHHPEKTPAKTEDVQEMAQTMQQQMLFIMPIMTAVLALGFPSGLTLYWVITTLFSLIQQYFISGWGGLAKYFAKIPFSLKR